MSHLRSLIINPTKFLGLLFSALLLVACASDNSTPEQTVQSYFQYISEDNIDKAIALIDIPKADNNEQDEIIDKKIRSRTEQSIKRMKNNGGLKSIEIVETKKVSETVSKVSFKMVLGNDQTFNESTTVELVDGKWLIVMKP